ncbi:hypothetical protein AAX71_09835, partial [Bifidobacterium adolescentis]
MIVRMEPKRIDCICCEAELDKRAQKQTHACGERQYGSCGDFALRCLFAQCADHQCSAESEHA